MSGTKRKRIDRPPQRQLTRHAIALFTKIRQCEAARSPETCIRGACYDIANYCSKECTACERWYTFQHELHAELKMPPWDWPCWSLNPFAPGTAAYRNWRLVLDDEQYALWCALETARRAARVSRKASADPGASPNANSPRIDR